jgi:RNA polymerase sigma-70 factor, ECF subfamily
MRHLKVVRSHSEKEETRMEEALLMNKLYFETGLTKLLEKEIGELVENALTKLPEKTRDVYLLSRKEYLNNSQISDKLGISVKAIEYHITKALCLLKQELQAYL